MEGNVDYSWTSMLDRWVLACFCVCFDSSKSLEIHHHLGENNWAGVIGSTRTLTIAFFSVTFDFQSVCETWQHFICIVARVLREQLVGQFVQGEEALKRIVINVLFFSLLISMLCRFDCGITDAGSAVIRVPHDYSTIQDAIRAANAGDSILVSAGTYSGRITIDKERLKIVGEDRASTIIDLYGDRIEIVADDVMLCEFTIRNSNSPNFAVEIRANGVVVSDNVFSRNYGGIRIGMLMGPIVERNSVMFNEIYESTGYGVFVRSARATVVVNNTFLSNNWAITFYGSSENVVRGNKITGTNSLCINLNNSTQNVVVSNFMQGGRLGVYVDYHSNFNNLTGNCIFNMEGWGIWVYNSFSNTLENNSLNNNSIGIFLERAAHIVLAGNVMNGNSHNFGISGQKMLHFLHSIDVSNTVDGKKVYYLINHPEVVIDSSTTPEAGYLGVVNSTNVIINDLNITSNWQGILLAYVSNSTISNIHVLKNYIGIDLFSSDDNCFFGNTVIENSYGILLVNSSNLLYKNNLVNNTRGVFCLGRNSSWDNGAEGNYWSDYVGSDKNFDGIGDIPYLIDVDNVDCFPLMEIVSEVKIFEMGTWDNLTYFASVFSNSTVAGFVFDSVLRSIEFNITGPTEMAGFCNVTIPNVFFGGHYEVWAEESLMAFSLVSNTTHSFLYFAYEHNVRNVKIVGNVTNQGSDVILFCIILVFLFSISTFLAVKAYVSGKRKRDCLG